MKHYIPNILTSIRIIAATLLLFTHPLSATFFVLYILCGISDMADGFFARKLNAQTRFGAKLDSIADLIFVAICFFKLYNIFSPCVWLFIFVIAAIKFSALAIAWHNSGVLVFHHTLLNKLTGGLLFVSLPFLQYQPIAIILCLIAGLAAIEELWINITDS